AQSLSWPSAISPQHLGHRPLAADHPELTASSCLLRALEQLLDAPPFFTRERPRLDHKHAVARARPVLLVVGLVLDPLRPELLEGLVLDTLGDHHDPGLLHLVGCDYADHGAARASCVLCRFRRHRFSSGRLGMAGGGLLHSRTVTA